MVIAVLSVVLLSGCGKKDQVLSGQVVAHVGDEVITKQELDNELRSTGIPPEKQNDPTTIRKVLGELAQRKYLLQQAMKARLDREPSVLLDLLRGREQVLANAYVSRAANAPIGQADVDAYVANNPLKFSERRVLLSEQIAFPLGSNSQAVIDDAATAKSLVEVDQRLTAAAVPHSRFTGALSSGDISSDLYKLIHEKTEDTVFFVRSGTNGLFFVVKSEEARPLLGEAAASAARQFIRADRTSAEKELASFSANLEAKYQGDYTAIMEATNGSSRN